MGSGPGTKGDSWRRMQKPMFPSTSPSLTSPCTAGRFPSKDRQAGSPEVQHAIIVQQRRISGEDPYRVPFLPGKYRPFVLEAAGEGTKMADHLSQNFRSTFPS